MTALLKNFDHLTIGLLYGKVISQSNVYVAPYLLQLVQMGLFYQSRCIYG